MNNEELFDTFAGAVVCDCTKRPEVIGRIIPTAFGDKDEWYICEWCRFVRDFGMEDNLEDIESKTVVKPVKKTTYDEYKEAYLDNLSGLQDLEDYGAFSDESIMPGCHSDYNYGEFGNLKEYLRDYQEDENMKIFFGGVITFARESLGLSVECLAKETSLPKYIIENIEAGEVGIKSKDKSSVKPITPVSLACASDVQKRKKLWWEDKRDTEIEEVVKNYLIKRKRNLG